MVLDMLRAKCSGDANVTLGHCLHRPGYWCCGWLGACPYQAPTAGDDAPSNHVHSSISELAIPDEDGSKTGQAMPRHAISSIGSGRATPRRNPSCHAMRSLSIWKPNVKASSRCFVASKLEESLTRQCPIRTAAPSSV